MITLEAGGLEMNVLTYGCIIASLAVPDAGGHTANVVLGFDRLEPYLDASPYFGAVVGRYANRIANARFAIDGREHRVSPNEPPNHLHGGFKGFDKRVWDAEAAGNGTARSSFAAEAPMAKKVIRARSMRRSPTRLAMRRAADELSGHRRCADARQPDPAFVLQSYEGAAMCWATASQSMRARICPSTSG